MISASAIRNVEAERIRRGMTIEELCNHLGITPTTYRSYKKGKAIPSLILIHLSDMFECSIDYLLGLVGSPKETKRIPS